MGMTIASGSPSSRNTFPSAYYKLMDLTIDRLRNEGGLQLLGWEDQATRDEGLFHVNKSIVYIGDGERLDEDGAVIQLDYRDFKGKSDPEVYDVLSDPINGKKIRMAHTNEIVDFSQAVGDP